jgi:hypothetical protein
LRELLLRGESIESHALHLFLLAVPDYLDRPSAIAVAAEHPAAVMLGLRLKKLGNLIQETIGGRAIHPVNAVPGGFGRVPAPKVDRHPQRPHRGHSGRRGHARSHRLPAGCRLLPHPDTRTRRCALPIPTVTTPATN